MRRIVQIIGVSLGMACCMPVFAWQNIVVKKTDTLNSLAVKYHPAGVSTMDMVIAMRNANPNLATHGLKSNMSLRIPTTVTEVRQAITGKLQHSATQVKSNLKASSKTPAKTTVKSVAVAKDPALIAQINADKATIMNLQQSVNSQIQTIQGYQAQITDLTSKLALANQTLATPVKAQDSWTFSDLFLPIWLITLVFYLRARRQYKAHAQSASQGIAAASAAAPAEPDFTSTAVNSSEPGLVKEEGTSWQQVELDIPESDVPVQTNIRLEPLLTSEEKEELVGEQQNIINAISNDHDNIDWHMALLEFYTKTNNESGYQRHYQNMLRSRLMQEGDPLWEKVRKIYLNCWVYRTEGV